MHKEDSATVESEEATRAENGTSPSPNTDRGEICVVHFIGRLVPGGVERRTLELIEATASKELRHVVCVTSGRQGTLDLAYKAAGADIEYIKIKSVLFPLRLARLLRRLPADVTHANLGNTSGYISLLSFFSGVPNRITHFQSDNVQRRSGLLSKVQNWIMRSFINRFSTQIVGLTPQNLELAWSPHWQQDSRCTVVPNGVRQQVSRPERPSDFDSFAADTIIIHAGRADLPTKNREKAISVFAAYLDKNRQSRLVFVGRDGKNPEQEIRNRMAWEQLVLQLGVSERVHFLGEKNGIQDYLFYSDGFLFTSKLEGLPGVVLEALSAGLCVTSSNLPGAEFISQHSHKISLLDPSDSDFVWASELYDAIPGKLDAEIRRSNIRHFEASIFTLEAAAARYVGLWRSHLTGDSHEGSLESSQSIRRQE